MNYWWIRIFDYKYNPKESAQKLECCDFAQISNKGTMLNEYYLKGDNLTRSNVKNAVIAEHGVTKFAKPRKKDGIYAVVLESDEFFYKRFCIDLPENAHCFNCHKPLAGKWKDFPKVHIRSVDELAIGDEEYFFCDYECRRTTYFKLENKDTEQWQNREGLSSTGVFGYIYHIYNRAENKHYIGQTKYMPFFRWQEHIKQNIKGDICDLTFEVITKTHINSQEYLDQIEAWWIQSFTDQYGTENVMNATHPRITLQYLIDLYNAQCAIEL